MKSTLKFVSAIVLIFGLLIFLNTLEDTTHTESKHRHKNINHKSETMHVDQDKQMTVQSIKIIQKENASGVQKDFEIKRKGDKKDKNKVYIGSTQLDIQPGDTIIYTQPTKNTNKIKIKSSERQLGKDKH